MTSEREMEDFNVSAAADENPGPNDLLEVTFQKDPNKKYKYLEAEPKILGVTEITLTVFYISSTIPLVPDTWTGTYVGIACSCGSIIAGSLAIAAQTLHLPTLKACLGMQIVMCVVYGFLLLTSLSVHRSYSGSSVCWYNYVNNTHDGSEHICTDLMGGFTFLELIEQLMEAVQIAVSATLAAYCCKVIQCCCPASYVPVINMKSPTAPE